MIQDSQDERWVSVNDFPQYSISDEGRVLNEKTGACLKPTRKPEGLLMVGLMRNGVQYKRSLALLVAQHFLPPSPKPLFNTPINLDGDRSNCHYKNLMWRPLWFSRKYMNQFVDNHNTYEWPIEDVEAREVYDNSMHASVINGVLDYEIVLSMMNNTYVWPTGQIFREYHKS